MHSLLKSITEMENGLQNRMSEGQKTNKQTDLRRSGTEIAQKNGTNVKVGSKQPKQVQMLKQVPKEEHTGAVQSASIANRSYAVWFIPTCFVRIDYRRCIQPLLLLVLAS
jgi:cytochrome c biogenesis protein ResB